MDVYEKIESLCKSNGIAITALEKELGFGRGSIGKMKNAKRPNAERLSKIADYFDIPLTELMEGDVKQSKKRQNIIRVYDHPSFFGDAIDEAITMTFKAKMSDVIKEMLTEDACEILDDYNSLTDEGRKKVRSYIDDLLLIPKYCQIDDANESDTVNINKIDADVAAHVDNGDFSEEQGIHVSKFSDMTKK